MIPETIARYSPGALSLDALPRFAETMKSEAVMLRLFDGSPPPHYLATGVSSFWNEENLWFWFTGSYGTLKTAPRESAVDNVSGKTMLLWENSDVYEVFIGPDARRKGLYREFQVAPDSRWIDISIDSSGERRIADFKWNSGMKAISRIDGEKKIWESVFQIPCNAFPQSPRRGDCWHCNFYRISGRTGEESYLSWSPVFEINFHRPDFFGTIVFR
jgi:hypothetical protein